MNGDLTLQPASETVPRHIEVVRRLQVEPELLGNAEESRQPEGRIRCDRAGAMDDFVNAARRHAQTLLTDELEFRLATTRKDRQHIVLGFCPLSAEYSNDPLQCEGILTFGAYPGGILTKFRDDLVAFDAFGYGTGVPIPPRLPADHWTHLAVQLRPDGYSELVINREVRIVSRLRHPDADAQLRWVFIWGSTVETRVLARDLRVWRGLRYHDRPQQ